MLLGCDSVASTRRQRLVDENLAGLSIIISINLRPVEFIHSNMMYYLYTSYIQICTGKNREIKQNTADYPSN